MRTDLRAPQRGEGPFAWQATLMPDKVTPGEFFVLALESTEGEPVQDARASVLDIRPRFYRFGNALKAIVGVGAKTPPGRHPVYLKATLSSGRVVGTVLRLTVQKRDFPTQHLRVSKRKAALWTKEALQRDQQKIQQAIAESHPRPLWEGPFLQPVQGRITTEYGTIRFINGRPAGRHYGVDMAAPKGTAVRASHHGRVVLAAPLEVHGQTVILDHGCNVFSLYLHLSKIHTKVGDKVQKCQIIGEVGDTGFATAPHLHWAMKVGKVSVNPWNWTRTTPRL